MKRVFTSSALVFLLFLLTGAPHAMAAKNVCNGNFGAVTLTGQLVVPAGAMCTLDATTIEGDITVEPGGTLVTNDATIKGNVLGTGFATRIELLLGIVGGDVQISDSQQLVLVEGVLIFGGLLVQGVDAIDVFDSVVAGDLVVIKNGDVTVFVTVIGGKFRCSKNRSLDQSDNTTLGKFQCNF